MSEWCCWITQHCDQLVQYEAFIVQTVTDNLQKSGKVLDGVKKCQIFQKKFSML